MASIPKSRCCTKCRRPDLCSEEKICSKICCAKKNQMLNEIAKRCCIQDISKEMPDLFSRMVFKLLSGQKFQDLLIVVSLSHC